MREVVGLGFLGAVMAASVTDAIGSEGMTGSYRVAVRDLDGRTQAALMNVDDLELTSPMLPVTSTHMPVFDGVIFPYLCEKFWFLQHARTTNGILLRLTSSLPNKAILTSRTSFRRRRRQIFLF